MSNPVTVHHPGLLKIDLRRDGRTLTMRVLEQGEELRNAGNHEMLRIADCGDYRLSSENVPELLSRYLLVRGMRTSGDDDEPSLTYPTEQDAITAYDAFRAMVDAVNAGAYQYDPTPDANRLLDELAQTVEVDEDGGSVTTNSDSVRLVKAALECAHAAGAASERANTDIVMADYQDAAAHMTEALTRAETAEAALSRLTAENARLREALEKIEQGTHWASRYAPTDYTREEMMKIASSALAPATGEGEVRHD